MSRTDEGADGADGRSGPDPSDLESASIRLAAVRARIDAAAARAGRLPGSVRLIGVTKTQPATLVRAIAAAGLEDLAENRVDALVDRVRELPQVRWHLIGRLQRNKVRDVVGRTVLVHGVDRRDLVDALDRRALVAGLVQGVLIQVNVGDDPAKGGCDLAEAEGLVSYARTRAGLRVEGLMTVPPLPAPGKAPTLAARPHFATLRALRDRLGSEPPPGTPPGATPEGALHLSMGMSDDLEAAVEEGATMVRVGTALFGARASVARTPQAPEEVR